jgi:diguanylate cyclase (GGDEF)-like protein
MALAGNGLPPSAVPGPDGERAAARLRAFRLIQEVQDQLVLEEETIERFIEEADARGWSDVVCANLYLAVVRSQQDGWRYHGQALTRLLQRAEADGDPAMTAIALACRSRIRLNSGDIAASVQADRDLVRATVLLDNATGGHLERASAHIECAIAYSGRSLWELELEHYRHAEALVGDQAEDQLLVPVILYNRAEVELNRVASLRQLDEDELFEEHVHAAAEALVAADVPQMPEAWLAELRVFATLLGALAPQCSVPVLRDTQAQPRSVYGGYLRLARALTTDDEHEALGEARAAVEEVDRGLSADVHELARCAGAELEAAIAGETTAGLAYARHLARLRWETRLSKLASIEALLHAQRLRSEHAILSQHAYLDELTGLGNRRALLRYVERLRSDGGGMIAAVLLDIDHFKAINDTHGHAAGDRALVRTAELLRASVRPGDLAIRMGGDEFLVVLCAPDQVARSRAEEIRRAIAAEPWARICDGLQVSASIGLAFGAADQHEAVLAAADAALYRSKAAGGACVSDA